MKVGILAMDHVLTELRGTHGDYSEMFQKLFRDYQDITFYVFDVINGELPKTNDYCAYIITGSKHSVYERLDWLERFKDWFNKNVDNHSKFVGICFGHQLLAQLLGGRVEKSTKGWGIGIHQYQIAQDFDWVNPMQAQFSLLASHQDQVVELPPGATLFANSAFCRTAGFVYKNKYLTFQGHPEFSANYLKTLIKHRRSRYTDEEYIKGLKSLSNNEDGKIVARWIFNFINQS